MFNQGCGYEIMLLLRSLRIFSKLIGSEQWCIVWIPTWRYFKLLALQVITLFDINTTQQHFAVVTNIEITSWKACAYRIFTWVAEVSEIELVSAANEWDFWYFTNKCENPVKSTFHALICLFYTYWDFHIKFCCVKKHCRFYYDQSERRKDFFTCEGIISPLWLVEVKSEMLFHIAKFDAKISVCIIIINTILPYLI